MRKAVGLAAEFDAKKVRKMDQGSWIPLTQEFAFLPRQQIDMATPGAKRLGKELPQCQKKFEVEKKTLEERKKAFDEMKKVLREAQAGADRNYAKGRFKDSQLEIHFLYVHRPPRLLQLNFVAVLAYYVCDVWHAVATTGRQFNLITQQRSFLTPRFASAGWVSAERNPKLVRSYLSAELMC